MCASGVFQHTDVPVHLISVLPVLCKKELREQLYQALKFAPMPGSRKFCQRGSSFDNFFLVDERIQIPL